MDASSKKKKVWAIKGKKTEIMKFA